MPETRGIVGACFVRGTRTGSAAERQCDVPNVFAVVAGVSVTRVPVYLCLCVCGAGRSVQEDKRPVRAFRACVIDS